MLALEYLTLGELTRGAIKYFAGRWYTPHIRLLEIGALGVWSGALGELFSSADWSGLRYLSFRGCSLGYSGVSALADSPTLASLRVLDLGGTGCANGGVAALCSSESLANLNCLRLDGNEFLSGVHGDLRRRFGERVKF
ncbi:MAG: hypothetical protein K2V38_26120 [Gemmataceae bacterium]|nr:hypothetical protein [Gemmataceae bacterium]